MHLSPPSKLPSYVDGSCSCQNYNKCYMCDAFGVHSHFNSQSHCATFKLVRNQLRLDEEDKNCLPSKGSTKPNANEYHIGLTLQASTCNRHPLLCSKATAETMSQSFASLEQSLCTTPLATAARLSVPTFDITLQYLNMKCYFVSDCKHMQSVPLCRERNEFRIFMPMGSLAI